MHDYKILYISCAMCTSVWYLHTCFYVHMHICTMCTCAQYVQVLNMLHAKEIGTWKKRIGKKVSGQNISGQNVLGQNVSGQNVLARNISATKCIADQTYRRPNESATKHIGDQTYQRPNVSATKRIGDQTYCRQNVLATKCVCDKMYQRQNVPAGFKKVISKIWTFLEKYSFKNPGDCTVQNEPIAMDYVRQAVSDVHVRVHVPVLVHVHVHVCVCIPVLVRVHVQVPVRDCDLKTVWCSTCDGVALKFNKKMLKIISNLSVICWYVYSADTFFLPIRFVRRYVLSADTFCPPIRFVRRYVLSADTFCRRYVISPTCYVVDKLCLPIRFVADTFCSWYVL